MPNFNQAPKLKFDGQKHTGQYYAIPQDLADIIFNKLGNSSAQLRIMMVLIGTKEGFKISDKWICDRTGLLHPSYITARKALVKRGWLTLDAAKDITVNINAIYAENSSNTTLPKEEETKEDCSNTILPQRSNTILPQPSNMVLPITNNTNNTTNNYETLSAKAAKVSLDGPGEEEKGSINNPIVTEKEWLAERHNHLTKLANGLFRYGNKFYKMKE